jgi:hypothetical protein
MFPLKLSSTPNPSIQETTVSDKTLNFGEKNSQNSGKMLCRTVQALNEHHHPSNGKTSCQRNQKCS